MNHCKPVILIVIEYYLPGELGGGTIRTISNLVGWLKTDFDFYILCRNHDLGDPKPYEGTEGGVWQQREGVWIRYLDTDETTLNGLHRLLTDIPYKLLILNGMFSGLILRILTLRRLKKMPEYPVLLSTSGQLLPGALRNKPLKKQVFLTLARLFGLYRRINWHTTSLDERTSVLREFGDVAASNITIVHNLPDPVFVERRHNTLSKETNTIRIVFLSRIVPIKNLDYVLDLLELVEGRAVFHIYGPIEDIDYWQKCQSRIEKLKSHIEILYVGPVSFADVTSILQQYHLFVLPSRSENFAYVIIEALLAGCPVLISDQTPWTDLVREGQAGWAVSLDQRAEFVKILNSVTAMGPTDYRRLLNNVSTTARKYLADLRSPMQMKELMNMLIRERT